jgi:hypothetical protein
MTIYQGELSGGLTWTRVAYYYDDVEYCLKHTIEVYGMKEVFEDGMVWLEQTCVKKYSVDTVGLQNLIKQSAELGKGNERITLQITSV